MRNVRAALHLPRLPLGSVARSMAVVGGSSVLAQGVLVLVSPILSRLYDPEAFGMLAVYSAMLSVLLAVASLRYDLAIPLATSPPEAIRLLAISALIAIVTSTVVAVVVLVGGAQIAAALGAAPLAQYLWLLPVALLVTSVASALASWATYHRAFPTIGRMRMAQGVGQAVTQVVLGVLRVGPIGLILGDVIGRAVGAERLFGKAVREMRSTRPTRAEIRLDLREHWGFARVMTAASLLSTVSLQIAFLLIPVLFDLESAGQYYLAYRMLVLPASLVAAAVSQVFFGEASHRRDDPQRLRDLAFNATIFLFAFSIPTYGIATVAGPALIQLVFGSQWALAGTYAQIMAPALVLWAVASPISTLLLVGRRERESLAFVAVELTLKIAALVAGAAAGSLIVGLVFLALATVAINIAALWRFLRVPRVRLSELVRPVGRILLLTAPWLALVAVVQVAVPVALLPVCAIAWGGAFGIAVWRSPQARALLSGTHD